MKAKIKDAIRLAYLNGDGDGPRSYVAVALAISATKIAQCSFVGNGLDPAVRALGRYVRFRRQAEADCRAAAPFVS